MGMIETDLAGMHQQHSAAQTSFNEMLKLVVLLEALPWVAASTLAADKQYVVNFQINQGLRYVLLFVLYFTSIIGLVGYSILVHNRNNVIFYARAINALRSTYLQTVPALKGCYYLPIGENTPVVRDRKGIMVLVSISLSIVNAFYVALACYIQTEGSIPAAICGFIVVLAVFAVSFLKITDHAFYGPGGEKQERPDAQAKPGEQTAPQG